MNFIFRIYIFSLVDCLTENNLINIQYVYLNYNTGGYIMSKLNLSQAKIAYEYKDIQLKLLNNGQNIKFNSNSLRMNAMAKYIKVNVNNKLCSLKTTKQRAELTYLKS